MPARMGAYQRCQHLTETDSAGFYIFHNVPPNTHFRTVSLEHQQNHVIPAATFGVTRHIETDAIGFVLSIEHAIEYTILLSVCLAQCWNSPQRIYLIVPTAQIGSPAGLESTYVQSTDRVHTRVIWLALEAPNKLILIP